MAKRALLGAAEVKKGTRVPKGKRNRYNFPRRAAPKNPGDRFEASMEILVNEMRVLSEKIDGLSRRVSRAGM